jgi:hypothetical protein
MKRNTLESGRSRCALGSSEENHSYPITWVIPFQKIS